VVQVAQPLQQLELLVVVVVLDAVAVVVVRMLLLAVVVAVMAQYLFGLGNLAQLKRT
jgi:hypothetical protein